MTGREAKKFADCRQRVFEHRAKPISRARWQTSESDRDFLYGMVVALQGELDEQTAMLANWSDAFHNA